MSRKFNLLDPGTDANAKNDSYLFAQADPINGISKKITVAQAKEVFATKKLKYIATGSEGTTLTIPALTGYEILLITRGMGAIYEVGATPDSDEFTWDDTSIVLGTVTNPGEKFNILYRTY